MGAQTSPEQEGHQKAARVDRERPHSLNPTQNHRRLRDAESGRKDVSQGGARQLLIQYQAVSPESARTGDSVQPEQVALMYLGMYYIVHMHVCNSN